MCHLPEWNNWRTSVPQCPANWERRDCGARYLTFQQDLASFYWARELNLALEVDWKYFDVANRIASTLASRCFAMWHKSCRDTLNRMRQDADRMMKRKMSVEIHSSKRTRSGMFLFPRRGSGQENVSSCSWRSRKYSLGSHDSNFRNFFLAPFSHRHYLEAWKRLI